MAAIVSREKRTFTMVRPYTEIIFRKLSPITRPDRMPASRMLEPVALTQFNPKTAGSLAGLGTTGGTRSTILLSPETGNCGLVILLGGVLQLAIEVNTFSGVFIRFLPVCVPHMKTITLRMIHGNQDRATSERVKP